MKKILISVATLFVSVSAHAASSANIGVLESSFTVDTVAISSFAATAVTTSVTLMPDRTSLVLQNQDTTNNVYCSENSAITGATNSFILYAGGGTISLNLRAASMSGAMRVYCISASTTGTSTLAVIQAY